MNRILAFAASGLAGMFMLAGAAAALSGINNGSFENGSGPNTNDWWWQVWGPSATVSGWTVPAGFSVDYIAEGEHGWEASDGIRSIDLDGDWPGAIQQTLATVPGQVYAVRFDLSGNPDPDTISPPGWNPVKRVEVTATGAAPRVYSYDIIANENTHEDMKYEPESYVFVATQAETTLAFRSLSTAGWWGPVLDNVRITGLKDACKKGGWQTLSDGDGHAFKNQGDCVSYAVTAGKH